MTHLAHVEAMQATHPFSVIYINVTNCELLSCVGLHVCPLPTYIKRSVLHAHACAGGDTCDYHLTYIASL